MYSANIPCNRLPNSFCFSSSSYDKGNSLHFHTDYGKENTKPILLKSKLIGQFRGYIKLEWYIRTQKALGLKFIRFLVDIQFC